MSELIGFNGTIGCFDIGGITMDEVEFMQRIAAKQATEKGGDDFKAVYDGEKREDLIGDSPELSRIAELMELCVGRYMVANFPEIESAGIEIEMERAGSWLNITKQGKPIHTHASDIVALIYLTDGHDTEDGRTVFHEPVNPHLMDAGTGLLQNAFRRSLRVTPRLGTVMVFPGYLEHEVEPYSGKGARITIGADFVASAGK